MLDEMSKRNVDVRNIIVREGAQTGLNVILNQQFDRAILTYPGLIDALKTSDILDNLLRRARHLHVSSIFLQTNLHPDLPKLFRRARSFGLTTSLDTNYDPPEKWIGLDELFSVTNIFLLNELDADWPCYSGKWTAGHRPCSLLWGGSNRSGFPKFMQSGL